MDLLESDASRLKFEANIDEVASERSFVTINATICHPKQSLLSPT